MRWPFPKTPLHLALLAFTLLLPSALAQAAPQGPLSIPWRRELPPVLPQGASGSVAIDHGHFAAGKDAVFTLEGGKLVRRTPDTNAMKAWSRETDLVGTPLPASTQVYVTDDQGAVLAFDASSMQRLWRFPLTAPPQSLVPAGPVLLVEGSGVITALSNQTGKPVWEVRGVDRDHTANHPLFVGGIVLVNHSPAESFQGEVYTGHDPATGKRLWRQSLGHGYLLGHNGNTLIFDARDWHNLLDDQGRFRLAEVDARTGKRRDFSHSLAALPGKLGLWNVTAGTPAIDADGTLWLVLEARNGGGARLARITRRKELRLWPLPPSRANSIAVDLISARLALTPDTVVVAAPDGQITTLNRQTGKTVSVALPGFRGTLSLTPLGDLMGVSREGGGTVILDAMGRVKFRVEDGGTPARLGQNLFVSNQKALFGFPLP